MPDSQVHLLHVEDDRILGLAMAGILERNGYSVQSVQSGEAAIEAVAEPEKPVDLILMDIDLGPGVDGTQAASRILDHHDIPIVFLTAHAEQEMVERVRGITRYGYVLKSSGEFVLLQAIEMALELFAAHCEREHREQQYRAITNLTGEIITQQDLDCRWTYLNDRACEFFGASREELLGRSFLDFLHPDDRARVESEVDLVRKRQPIRRTRNRQLTPGGWRTVDWNSEIIHDRDGTMIGFQATGRDITDQAQTEHELQTSRELLGKVMESNPVSILRLNREGMITYANTRATEVLGLSASDATARSYNDPEWQITGPDGETIPDEQLPFQLAMRTGRSVRDFEHAIVWPDGRRVLLSISAAPLFDADGEFDGTVASIEDITKRREIETQVREQEIRLRSIFRHLPGMVYQYEVRPDGTRRFPFVSESVEQLLGYAAVDAMGDPDLLLNAVHPDDVPRLNESIERSRRDLSDYSIVHRLITKAGDAIWLSAQATPARREDGTVTWTGLAVDISAQRSAEETVRALLHEKEILLGEINHRVKNDIGLIEALVSMQLDNVESPEARDAIRDTLNRLDTIREVYDRMSGHGDDSSVQLAELVERQIANLRGATIAPDTKLEVDLQPVAVSHRVAVSVTILVNELLTNASKYASVADRALEIRVSIRVDSGEIEISVSDNGPGFPPAVIEENKFGYGLNIVDSLATQYDGSISLRNDAGAVVVVRIRADEPAAG